MLFRPIGFAGLCVEIEKSAARPNASPDNNHTLDAGPASARELLQKVIARNRHWLDPRPQNLSYVLTGGTPGKEPEMFHRVFISGDKVRWEMDTNFDIGREATYYTYVCLPEKVVCLRAPKRVNKPDLREVGSTHPFRQGMRWRTAIHAIAEEGVPQDCRIVQETEPNDGRVVVIEANLEKRRSRVGLGLYHVNFGGAGWLAGKVRLHIRLPDLVPIREDYGNSGNPLASLKTVSYGPEFMKIGEQFAPSTLRFESQEKDGMQPGRAMVIEGRFRDAHGVWLLDEATNTIDGKVVRRMKVSDVSIEPVPEGKFETTVEED